MLKPSKKKVKNFIKLLRKKLLVEGLSKPYVHSMDDETVLETFRKCADCDEIHCTRDQQMHAILEFDTPERAFEVLYEEEDHTDELEFDFDSESEEDLSGQVREINFDFEELEFADLDDSEVELIDEICAECFNAIVKHFDEEDAPPEYTPVEDAEDEEIVRGKWIMEGSSTVSEMIDNIKNFLEYMKRLRASGFELAYPVEDGYGYLVKRKPKAK